MKCVPRIMWLLAAVVLLAPASSAWGRWAYVSLEELVAESDFVVVGTLTDVVQFSDLSQDYGRGIITVEEVLWGRIGRGQRVVLAWDNGMGVICPRLEHAENQGNRGVWLLTASPTGHVRADYPWRFRGLSEKAKIVELLASRPAGTAKQYVQIVPIETLLNADWPYMHYVLTSVIAFVLLASSVWWLAGRTGIRRTARPLHPLACPYCTSVFKLTVLGQLLHPYYRCPACGRRMRLRTTWFWSVGLHVIACAAGFGAGYVAWFWTRGFAALPAFCVALIVSSLILTRQVSENHGQLLPAERNCRDSK